MSKTAVYIINEKEYSEAMKTLDKLGYQWIDGDSCSAEWKLTGGVDRLIFLILYSDDKVVAFTTTEPNDCDNIISLEEFIRQGQKILESFTKANLEDGMVVETNGGDYYMYFKKFERFIKEDGYLQLNRYNDDLTNKYEYDDPTFNIKAVYTLKNLYSLDLCAAKNFSQMEKIWERPKVRMTIKEIEEKLGIKNLEIIEEPKNE